MHMSLRMETQQEQVNMTGYTWSIAQSTHQTAGYCNTTSLCIHFIMNIALSER